MRFYNIAEDIICLPPQSLPFRSLSKLRKYKPMCTVTNRWEIFPEMLCSITSQNISLPCNTGGTPGLGASKWKLISIEKKCSKRVLLLTCFGEWISDIQGCFVLKRHRWHSWGAFPSFPLMFTLTLSSLQSGSPRLCVLLGKSLLQHRLTSFYCT